MSRLNDLAGVIKDQVDALNHKVYNLVLYEMNEIEAAAYMQTMVCDLNELLDKVNCDTVTTDRVDRFGREK